MLDYLVTNFSAMSETYLKPSWNALASLWRTNVNAYEALETLLTTENYLVNTMIPTCV